MIIARRRPLRYEFQVGFLHHLFGFVLVGEDAARDPEQPPIVAAHESLEGARVLAACPLDQQQIRKVHRLQRLVGAALAACAGRVGGVRLNRWLQHVRQPFVATALHPQRSHLAPVATSPLHP